MLCPKCGQSTSVSESRTTRDGVEVRRRRACTACEYRFTTYERTEEHIPIIVKRDGRRERFAKEKLLEGVKRACEKRKITSERVEELVRRIARKVSESDQEEISSKTVGDLVLEELAELDTVAFIRFASVYLAFEDAEDFKNTIRSMERNEFRLHRKAELKSRTTSATASAAPNSSPAAEQLEDTAKTRSDESSSPISSDAPAAATDLEAENDGSKPAER